MSTPIPAEDFDLARWLRRGDRILVAQGSGEPASLSRRLPGASQAVPGLTACIGLTLGDTLCGSGCLAFESYGVLGTAARLAQETVSVLPLHFSQYAAQIADVACAATS